MRRHVLYAACISVIIIAGCKKDESNPGDSGFSDKLTLGTGMSGFNIVGETATFIRTGGQASLYWRLECKDDYGNQGAQLKIEKEVSAGTYTAYSTTSPPVLQDYGHIYVNGPVTISSAGTYRATGIHCGSSRSVAVKDFTVQ